MKSFLKYSVLIIACIVALAYATGYDYLLTAVAKTYLRGETSATVDDGKLFPKHEIQRGNPQVWEKDSAYNKKSLPKTLLATLKNENTYALVIIKNGKLLHEEYWENQKATSQTNSFSVAKTVTAMLLGTAIEDGFIKSENQKFTDFYPEFGKNENAKQLTLKDLVTMQSALDWDESYNSALSHNAKAYYGNSLADAVLETNVVATPGKKFEYQSGATQLLGFALMKAVKMPLSEYASKRLWKPLGMEQNAYWTTDDYGIEKTFCCIHSNARDFAKLGQLILDEGKKDSLQIISKSYIQKMTNAAANSHGSYSYGMWINAQSKYPYYYFRGILGQYIIVVPSQKLVIVRTGNSNNINLDSDENPTLVNALVNQIAENY